MNDYDIPGICAIEACQHHEVLHKRDTDRRKLEMWDEIINAIRTAINEVDFDDANRVQVRDEFQRILAKAAEIDGNK